VVSALKSGAGDGNRTRVRSLGSFYTAIVRRPLWGHCTREWAGGKAVSAGIKTPIQFPEITASLRPSTAWARDSAQGALALAQQRRAVFLTLRDRSFSVKRCSFAVTEAMVVTRETQNAHAERLHWQTR